MLTYLGTVINVSVPRSTHSCCQIYAVGRAFSIRTKLARLIKGDGYTSILLIVTIFERYVEPRGFIFSRR